MKERKAIIFDLDGTLCDSGGGIINSALFALGHFGIKGDPQVMQSIVGPPPRYSFKHFLGLNDEQVEEAVRLYQEHFNQYGLFQNSLYPGIWELLEDLTKAGKTLAIATNRVQPEAHRAVEHLGLNQFFPQELVVGVPPGTAHAVKAEIVATALGRLGATADEGIMVGDREFDLEGGRANGLAVIGVTYGFGTKEEIAAQKPTAMAHSVQELRELLVG